MKKDSPPAVKEPEIIDALAYFFRYLLDLDDYTLGIIGRMITRWHREEALTIGELSDEHGCSRQAMHRKILSIIGEHPELSALLSTLLPKLSRSRRYFLQKKKAAVTAV
jgi:hypothetical protein